MSVAELIIVGASARAACFSAKRGGMVPYWIDQFGDYDLAQNFKGERVNPLHYPQALLEKINMAPNVPFLFTGAMENHLDVLEQLETCRPLLGNSAAACRNIRDPDKVVSSFKLRGIACPEVRRVLQTGGAWLKKPLAGSGGRNIQPYRLNQEVEEQYFLQQLIEGESRAAIFLANGRQSRLLGVTRQLVGEAFLNADPYAYCGSIGPLTLCEQESGQWQMIGDALCEDFALKGLFCVDALVLDGTVFPVEVNPRYSASVEVLEMALGVALLKLHCRACEGHLPASLAEVRGMVAKAYLFAEQDLRCPHDIRQIYPPDLSSQQTADIPQPGSTIQRGFPLMSVITEVENDAAALPALAAMAEKLYRQFTVL